MVFLIPVNSQANIGLVLKMNCTNKYLLPVCDLIE